MDRFHSIKSLNRQENSSINFNLFNKFRTSNILLSIHCHLADNIMNIHVYMIHTVCLQKTNVLCKPTCKIVWLLELQYMGMCMPNNYTDKWTNEYGLNI